MVKNAFSSPLLFAIAVTLWSKSRSHHVTSDTEILYLYFSMYYLNNGPHFRISQLTPASNVSSSSLSEQSRNENQSQSKLGLEMASAQSEKLRWDDHKKAYYRESFDKTTRNLNPMQNLASAPEAGGTGGYSLPHTASDDDSSSPNLSGQRRYVKISVNSKSRQEVREIRRKLTAELDQVRAVSKKYENLEKFDVPAGSQYSASDAGLKSSNSAKKANAEARSAAPLPHKLSVSVPQTSGGDKRTPKANQYYRNSEFVLGKEKSMPLQSTKKSKNVDSRIYNQAFKSCTLLLAKLMKHKHGWVFNTPVDVKALGLRDYYNVIKHPMDLGTVKNKLNQNWYKTPKEFAEDVKLTFRNAMTYNPKGQDVHVMAEHLLQFFEEKWPTIEAEYVHSSPQAPVLSSKKPPPLDARKLAERSDSTANYPLSVDSKSKPAAFTKPHVGRPAGLKKPKAKDLHKRDMTFEEKQKLSDNLQNLPPEKLENIVQIIKKRSSALSQHDDEIEVDIDSVDIETLWELDRFVTNYKKFLWKNKRKAEVTVNPRLETYCDTAQEVKQEKTSNPFVGEVNKEGMTMVDEKDIASSSPKGDSRIMNNASRSSSSSSSSSGSGSSSSDSDTDGSSAGSDAG